MKKVLLIFNREPYDNTDVTWNGLRLADTLKKKGHEVRIFLMNDSVDLARDILKPPPGYDQDLSQMLRDLIACGVPVQVCGTCMSRCGIFKNHPYFEGAETSTMGFLADWITDSIKFLHFSFCIVFFNYISKILKSNKVNTNMSNILFSVVTVVVVGLLCVHRR